MTLQENIQELQERMKYSGFGEGLNKELEKQMRAGKNEIRLEMKMDMGNKSLEYGLNFRKSDEGRYFYNGFDARLKSPEGKEESQRFYQNQGISAKEAFNLLEGRSVFKSLFNKEGERFNAWLQLDLGNRDSKGQNIVAQFHQNYGFDLEASVGKLPIKGMEFPDQKDLLNYSLKKGNRHQVELEGKDGKYYLEANPKFKTINLYDADGKKLKIDELGIKKGKSKSEKTMENQRQEKSSKRKVKV